MDYKNQLICFIDVLGFKEATKQSISAEELRNGIYDIFDSLNPEKISPFVKESIPTLYVDNTVKSSIPLNVTQFSDSFVISCPAGNGYSYTGLLRSVYLINLLFFFNLGMLVRGAITKGPLIHKENGPLFGPAMINAYELESKQAIYPRVLVSDNAYKDMMHIAGYLDFQRADLTPIEATSFDGHHFIDIISISNWKYLNDIYKNTLENQLYKIEKDICKNSSSAYPKIAYLLDRWNAQKLD